MTTKPSDTEQLADLIVGGSRSLTNDDVAELTGMAPEQIRRLWRVLGFPDPADARAFGEYDVLAARDVAESMERGLLDETTVFGLMRAFGQTISRLADWQVSVLVDQLERDVERGKVSSRIEGAAALVEHAGPSFERLLNYAWRRHLAAAVARVEAQGEADEELLSQTMSVGFADLTRFTALTNQLTDTELAELVEAFETRCGDLVTARGGRVIKTLGDAMLFVHDDPVEATKLSMEIVRTMSRRGGLPDLRVGLATGLVLSRLGDVFGPPVNLAARLSHVARSNRILVDKITADALGDEFETRALPPRPMRGFGNYSPITVTERHTFRSR